MTGYPRPGLSDQPIFEGVTPEQAPEPLPLYTDSEPWW